MLTSKAQEMWCGRRSNSRGSEGPEGEALSKLSRASLTSHSQLPFRLQPSRLKASQEKKERRVSNSQPGIRRFFDLRADFLLCQRELECALVHRLGGISLYR